MPDGPRSILTATARLPRRGLVALIRIYQATVSPALPALFGSNTGCRFSPTCSHYAVEALQTRGVIVGVALTFWRILRCNPLFAGGSDPVPSKRSTPRCTRVTA